MTSSTASTTAAGALLPCLVCLPSLWREGARTWREGVRTCKCSCVRMSCMDSSAKLCCTCDVWTWKGGSATSKPAWFSILVCAHFVVRAQFLFVRSSCLCTLVVCAHVSAHGQFWSGKRMTDRGIGRQRKKENRKRCEGVASSLLERSMRGSTGDGRVYDYCLASMEAYAYALAACGTHPHARHGQLWQYSCRRHKVLGRRSEAVKACSSNRVLRCDCSSLVSSFVSFPATLFGLP